MEFPQDERATLSMIWMTRKSFVIETLLGNINVKITTTFLIRIP